MCLDLLLLERTILKRTRHRGEKAGRMSLVAYGDSDSESEAEEGEGEPTTEADKSDVRKLLGLLPPPKGSKPSGKHPVRISLPTLKSGVHLYHSVSQ